MTRSIRLGIGGRLGLAFASVCLVFLLAVGLALVYSGSAQRSWKHTSIWDQAVKGAAEQVRGIQGQMAAQALYVATLDPRYKDEWEAEAKRALDAGKAVAALGDPVIAKITSDANAADEKHDAAVNDQLFPAVAAGDRDAALAALRLADENVRIPLEAVTKITARVDELRMADVAKASAAASRAKLVGLVAAGVGLLLAALIAVFVSRGIAQTIRTIVAAVEPAAQGDLTQRITLRRHDELGDLATCFNGMVESLAGLVSRIEGVSRGLLASSAEMAATSSRLERRSTKSRTRLATSHRVPSGRCGWWSRHVRAWTRSRPRSR
jgi:HAMP domain-containing protein